MNLRRKLGAALLAAALLLSGLPTARAEDGGFPDVSPEDWYALPVTALAKEGVIGGREDGKFHPNDPITRAEFLRLLSAISGREAVTEAQLIAKFKDVKLTSWYAPSVSWGVQEKLIGGMTETTFAPESPINRQQIALILYRFNKNIMGRRLPLGDSTLFSDSGNLSAWAKKEALALGEAGLISGYKDHSFRPAAQATRAEAAQILYNYLQAYKNFDLGCSNRDLRYIMHGGGDIDGRYQISNSLESVNESIRRGNNLLEIDLSWTADGFLVCAHDVPEGMTRDEFLATAIHGELTPMDLTTLANFMRTHPDVRVIPDVKRKNLDGLTVIREQCSDLLDRFLPYITRRADYEAIRQLGFPNLILTTYQMSQKERQDVRANVEFARKNDLVAIALSYENAALTKQYLAAARKEGVPMVLDTVNSAVTMESYVLQGADGFFTNSQTLKIPRFQHWGF